MKFNDVVQWLGTASFLAMYTLMSLNMYPWNIVVGTLGGACYLIWSLRVANVPQTVTNVASMTICLYGLFRAFG